MIRKVHVFQCGSADLYGVTQDQTGANLPIDECKEGWRFLKTVLEAVIEGSPIVLCAWLRARRSSISRNCRADLDIQRHDGFGVTGRSASKVWNDSASSSPAPGYARFSRHLRKYIAAPTPTGSV
jgi:hypothetical protein